MRRFWLLIVFIFLAVSVTFGQFAVIDVARNAPADFPSDGCSLFPEGNYGECCVIHDREYYRGGSFKERRASDKRLYRCVRSKKGWHNEIVAPVMYLGVRVFGVSFLPTSFRWGFGQKKASIRRPSSDR